MGRPRPERALVTVKLRGIAPNPLQSSPRIVGIPESASLGVVVL